MQGGARPTDNTKTSPCHGYAISFPPRVQKACPEIASSPEHGRRGSRMDCAPYPTNEQF